MAYIIGLFLILAVIFSSMGGGDSLVGGLFSKIKNNVSATIFPKTEREIIIDNLNSNNQYLDKFFSEAAPVILNLKNVSENDKITIKKAAETYSNSKNLISNLSKLEKEEKGPLKTASSFIEKVLNIYNDSSKTSSDTTTLPDIAPTSIPPQCS